MRVLMRRGGLVEEMGQTYLADSDADGDEARTLPGLGRDCEFARQGSSRRGHPLAIGGQL